MDYLKQYKSFISSYYLSEGVRISIGVTLPAVVMGYFNNLSSGIIVSLGALCASMPDNAGPIHHRRNAMLVCTVVVFIVALLTGFASGNNILLGATISIFCFVFAMIGVYGNRATSIGLAALLVMVLNIDRPRLGWDVFYNSLYILCGGAWYMLLSLSIYGFRPYKLAQQALGECIQSTADYLRIKASFYEKQNDYNENYTQLLDKQIEVHQKQDLVRELLFKSRDIIRESTTTGRILLIAFLNIIDLFERIITSYQDYNLLHEKFDKSNILEKFRQSILLMVNELDEIGIAVKSGKSYLHEAGLRSQIAELKKDFEKFRDEYRTSDNVEAFISLRQILESMEDIAVRIYALESYTTYDKRFVTKQDENIDYDDFVIHENIEPGLLIENLSFKSNIFRHSIRLCIATLAGFIASRFFSFGHSYWILLTIIVIIKPGYSLTKKRNSERFWGTIAGALIGLAALYIIKDKTALFVIMIIFMIGAYSFMRIKYLVFVSLMTPYILLLFHLLNPNNFQSVITDRIIDTVIGSVIAFIANIFLFPAWEHEQITEYMLKMVEDNLQYFTDVANSFTGKPATINQYKLSRKNAFVSLANLSDAFSRMLSEPKSKQINSRELHQFVVSNHMLTSHIATLAYYAQRFNFQNRSYNFLPLVRSVESKLDNIKAKFTATEKNEQINNDESEWRLFNSKINSLAEKRKQELQKGIIETQTKKELSNIKPVADQFNFIMNITGSLEKLNFNFHE
ncbi:MAG TPA: FUSC family membrane protein [Puia sp.]|nr:FUSC family membrane protein [Puia sp.]